MTPLGAMFDGADLGDRRCPVVDVKLDGSAAGALGVNWACGVADGICLAPNWIVRDGLVTGRVERFTAAFDVAVGIGV